MAKIPVSQQLKVMEKHLISTLSNSLIAPRDNNLATITKFIIDTSDLVTNLLEITHGVLIIRPTVHTIHGSYVLPVNTINYIFIPSANPDIPKYARFDILGDTITVSLEDIEGFTFSILKTNPKR